MRLNRNRFALLTLAILAGIGGSLVASGCRGTKPPYDVSADPYGRQQVYINDDDLAEVLRFGQPRVSYDEADLMHVSLDVRAATNRRWIIQHRVRFFDRTGQQLYVTQWQTRTLESNVQETITATSTTPQADSFQIDIRTAE